MENASKALLLAAETLISIMVIALIVYFYRSSIDTSKQFDSEAQSQQVEQYNGKFLKLVGSDRVYIYDVLTIANFARSRNKSIDNGDINEDKMTVTLVLGTNKSYTLTDLEDKEYYKNMYGENGATGWLSEYYDNLKEDERKTFNMTINSYDPIGKVQSVTFTLN